MFRRTRTTVEYFIDGVNMSTHQIVPVDKDEAVSELRRAVKHGDAPWVKRLLDAGLKLADVDKRIASGGCGYDYLLHEAAGHNNHALMVLMLNAGADVNRRSRNGEHLLTSVARNQASAVMEDLLNMQTVRRGEAFEEVCHEALCVALRNRPKRMCKLLWPFRQRTAEARQLYIEAMANTEENPKFVRELLQEADDSERVRLYELLGAKCVLNDDLTKARKWWGKADIQVNGDQESTEDQALVVVERLVPSSLTLVDFLWRTSQEALERGLTEKAMKLLRRGVTAMRKSKLIRWSEGVTNFFSYILKLPPSTVLERFTLNSLLPILDVFSISYANWQAMWQNHPAKPMHFICRQDFYCEECEFMREATEIFQKMMIMLSPLHMRGGEQEKQRFEVKLVSIMQVHPGLPNMPLFTPQLCLSLALGGVDVAKCLVRASARVSGMSLPLHLKVDEKTDQTPFHILAEYLTEEQLLGEESMVAFMERHGAHLCDTDRHTGERVLDILERRGMTVPSYRPVPLLCLAARQTANMVATGEILVAAVPDMVKNFIHRH